MQVEYEATFTNVDKNEIRSKLESIGATLERDEYLQRRTVFNLPKNNEVQGGWLRIRDEGDKITLSLKVVDGDKIEDQKEACITVSDYSEAELILTTLGADKKAYQETKRELWLLDGVEITIDTWPFLEPFIEVERYPFLKTTILSIIPLIIQTICQRKDIASRKKSKTKSLPRLSTKVLVSPTQVKNMA